MIRSFRSTVAEPFERGREFGEAHRAEIASVLDVYERLVARGTQAVDVHAAGRDALASIGAWAPALATEIEGLAAGADMSVELVAALNARTELLAAAGANARRGECSVAVVLGTSGSPLAAQAWDWHQELEDLWCVWTIEHPGGRVVHTLTEFGIVGKLGVSSSGLGVMLNLLRHASDGAPIGTPIHVIARRVLDEARDVDDALTLIASAKPSASSALTVIAADEGEETALTAEVNPAGTAFVLPDPSGRLVHTNHFLSARAEGDREPMLGPDSFFRYEILRRRVAAIEDDVAPAELRRALASHLGGGGAICCHPAPEQEFGSRYATLATISLDVAERRMRVWKGGPCDSSRPPWSSDGLVAAGVR